MFAAIILFNVKLDCGGNKVPVALFNVIPDTAGTVSVTPDNVTNVHSNPSVSNNGMFNVCADIVLNITIPPLSTFVSVYPVVVSTTSLLFTYSLVTAALPVVSASIKAFVTINRVSNRTKC